MSEREREQEREREREREGGIKLKIKVNSLKEISRTNFLKKFFTLIKYFNNNGMKYAFCYDWFNASA